MSEPNIYTLSQAQEAVDRLAFDMAGGSWVDVSDLDRWSVALADLSAFVDGELRKRLPRPQGPAGNPFG